MTSLYKLFKVHKLFSTFIYKQTNKQTNKQTDKQIDGTGQKVDKYLNIEDV